MHFVAFAQPPLPVDVLVQVVVECDRVINVLPETLVGAAELDQQMVEHFLAAERGQQLAGLPGQVHAVDDLGVTG